MSTESIIQLLEMFNRKDVNSFLILLKQLDTKTRLCIRDSLLRLAHSATERQIAGDRSSTNKTNKDEYEASENDTPTRRTR